MSIVNSWEPKKFEHLNCGFINFIWGILFILWIIVQNEAYYYKWGQIN